MNNFIYIYGLEEEGKQAKPTISGLALSFAIAPYGIIINYITEILGDSSMKLFGSKRKNIEASYWESFQDAFREPIFYVETDVQGEERNTAQPREKHRKWLRQG